MIPPPESPGSLRLSSEQEERLRAVPASLDWQAADERLLEEMAGRIEAVLATRVLIFCKQQHVWSTIRAASSSEPAALGAAGETDPVFDLNAIEVGTPAVVSVPSAAGETPWTVVACATRPHLVIAVRGDWSDSLAAVRALSFHATRAWQTRFEAQRARSGLLAHRLARQLSRVEGLQAVYETLVRRMPAAVHARVAALAVPDPADGRLAIVATHGYPKELVEHLRIEPQSGVLGAVFESGRPMLVKTIAALPSRLGRRRRARYRTDSFIAMPLVGARDVLGVLCVTDRQNDEPFTQADVGLLRAMAAPAALALGRERATVQAEGFALTAAIDALSGAFNRRHFHVRLEEELQRSVRHALSLGFLMIDIDDFKAVNDSYGHLAGDTIIRDVADILRRSVRVFDVCARFGGEEFAIIMPGSVVESAAVVAERIRERIEGYHPSEPGFDRIRITVSIGLAVSSPGMSSRDLIDSADHALYNAKRAGKNRVKIASQDASSETAPERRPPPQEARE